MIRKRSSFCNRPAISGSVLAGLAVVATLLAPGVAVADVAATLLVAPGAMAPAA